MTNISSGREDFLSRYADGKPAILWATRVADLETPVSASLKLLDDSKPGFLLESVEGGEVRGRYSVIGLDPDLIWRCHGAEADISYLNKDGGLTHSRKEAAPCLESLRELIKSCQFDVPAGLPPMASGLIGFLGYDMVKQMERLPDANPDALAIPDACLMRPRVVVVFDAVADTLYIITTVYPEAGVTPETAYAKAEQRIQAVHEKLDTPLASGKAAVRGNLTGESLQFASNTTREQYHAMVEKAKEYILAGDIFQVVPSQRFTADFPYSPFALYRSLRHLNPSPFLVYLNLGDYALVASSPEILVRLRDEKVTIRPIAGTRKRGATREEDFALEQDLLADPKEIAEHLMLLDLGRNDVGRVAKHGTVQVTERMIIERYSHVMHIVSNVEGDIDPRYEALDALIGGFPAGTVSGAPKIRAMEIIDELEVDKRKFYGGCIGYFSANGSMDTCIALRTGLVKDGKLYLQAGGGVVADSDPEAEYQESCNKAKAVMRAAEYAGKF